MIDGVVNCPGCSSCFEICPTNAIRVNRNSTGFFVPSIDKDKCISCGLCSTICPIQNANRTNHIHAAFCFQNTDESLRAGSSAGGFVSAVARFVFEQKGYLFSVGLHGAFPHFVKCQSLKDCLDNSVFSSKYVFCDPHSIFGQIKEELTNGHFVCFIGLPCQVAGLKSYLKKDYSNLLLIDLVCYGAPSPSVYELFIREVENRFKSTVSFVNFRDKTFGYSSPNLSITFENGKVVSQNKLVKSYLKLYFNNLSINDACYRCFFKGKERHSDLTIGDCQEIKRLVPSFDDDKGTTAVYINSSKGEELFKSIISSANYKTQSVNLDQMIELAGKKLMHSAQMPSNRKLFLETLQTSNYKLIIKKFAKLSFVDKAVIIIKKAMILLHITNFKVFKKLKKR